MTVRPEACANAGPIPGNANVKSAADDRRAATDGRQSAGRHLIWFGAVSAVAFLIPFVFSSRLRLHHDAFYAVYFVGISLALAAYVRATQTDLLRYLRPRWRASLVVGALAGAFVVWSVLGRIEPTPHPSGAYFAFEIIWRGAVYGMVDALLLSAFPGLVAFNILGGNLVGVGRRLLYAGCTAAMVMFITAAYHAGYAELRNKQGVTQPQIGNTIISLPVIITTNPIGSVIAHTAMHLAAVTHAYESKERLPPQTFAR